MSGSSDTIPAADREKSEVDDEEDEFWKIALTTQGPGRFYDISDGCSSDYEHDGSTATATAKHFRLESDTCDAVITIRLSPLPNTDGVWSPVGSDAWYSSALLTTMLLNPCRRLRAVYDNKKLLLNTSADSTTSAKMTTSTRFVALELGSGAVGLPGIALGWLTSQWPCVGSQVILTDNDSDCLEQLESNVRNCLQQFRVEYAAESLHDCQDDLLTVSHLDWQEGIASLMSGRQFNRDGQQLDLVIGSELVYTHANARACYAVVQSILQAFPDVLIMIVQVTDRDGWENVFLPKLRDDDSILVKQEPISLDVHEKAMKLLPMGGVLDRFDFGLCFISKRAVQPNEANAE